MGVLVDVTERKLAEEEIHRLKERLEAENVYLRAEVSGVHRYGDLIGRSEGMQKVLRQVNQVAETDMTVLILGETGTGKELVARAVHGQSGRRERPLVKVNCSALPGELIESELFGDEVGDLPLKLQAKLLRVLHEVAVGERQDDQSRCSSDRRHQPQPHASGSAGKISNGSLLSAQRVSDRIAAA